MKRLSEVVLLVVIACQLGLSQENPRDSVTVIKAFEARLLDSEKIRFSPQKPEADTTPRSYFYQIELQSPELPGIESVWPDKEYKFDSPFGRDNSFIRIGAGWIENYHVSGQYLRNSSEGAYGIRGFHEALNDSEEYSDFQTTLLQAFGRQLINDRFEVGADVSYRRQLNQIVPWTDDDRYDEEDAIRTYGLVDATLEGNTYFNDWYWSNTFEFKRIRENDGAWDQLISISTMLSKTKERKSYGLALRGNIQTASIQSELNEDRFDHLIIHPFWGWLNDNWKFRIAANASLTRQKTYFFPELGLDYRIGNWNLGLHIDGQLKPQSLGFFLLQNPYTSVDTLYNHFASEYRGKLSVRYGIGGYSIEPRLVATTFSDRGFFIWNDESFSLAYDDGSAIELGAKIQGNLDNHWSAVVDWSGTLFNMDDLEHPWHIPRISGHHELRTKYDNWGSQIQLVILGEMFNSSSLGPQELPYVADHQLEAQLLFN